jgi:hypothetical protein
MLNIRLGMKIYDNDWFLRYRLSPAEFQKKKHDAIIRPDARRDDAREGPFSRDVHAPRAQENLIAE